MYIIVIEIKEVVNYDILKNFKNKNQIILDNVIIVIYNVIKQNKSFKNYFCPSGAEVEKEILLMILFAIGLFLGLVCGVGIMALLQASKTNDKGDK